MKYQLDLLLKTLGLLCGGRFFLKSRILCDESERRVFSEIQSRIIEFILRRFYLSQQEGNDEIRAIFSEQDLVESFLQQGAILSNFDLTKEIWSLSKITYKFSLIREEDPRNSDFEEAHREEILEVNSSLFKIRKLIDGSSCSVHYCVEPESIFKTASLEDCSFFDFPG